MTHPKARTKPRRRERRDPQDRILLTPKGRALLEVLDQLPRARAFHRAAMTAKLHDHGRATPCAPNRAAPAAPANGDSAAGTSAAHPRTPAGKSGAAELAEKPETSR